MSDSIRQHFHDQGTSCEKMGSPFTGRLCHLLAENLGDETETGKAILTWPGDPMDDNLGARLCGALHALVLAGKDPALKAVYPPNEVSDAKLLTAVTAALHAQDRYMLAAVASPPQTNDVARSAMLLPGFLMIARETGLPLALNEIGSSAGLNLFWDRYYYDFDGREWGDTTSPVRLRPEVRGTTPPLEGEVAIACRRGSDIAPIDINDDAATLRLRSFIWADQRARMERLNAAIELAGEAPPTVDKADAADWLEAQLNGRKPDEAVVLFHSMVWQYLPRQTRRRIEQLMTQVGDAATSDAPFAWLRLESIDDFRGALWLNLWPEGATRRLANADTHGRWIEWLE